MISSPVRKWQWSHQLFTKSPPTNINKVANGIYRQTHLQMTRVLMKLVARNIYFPCILCSLVIMNFTMWYDIVSPIACVTRQIYIYIYVCVCIRKLSQALTDDVDYTLLLFQSMWSQNIWSSKSNGISFHKKSVKTHNCNCILVAMNDPLRFMLYN